MREQSVRRIGLALVSFGIVLAFQASAGATVKALQDYKKAYPGKAAKEYSCKVCHEAAVGKADNLNAYGKALGEAKHDFKAVETQDSDSDGVSNADELAAGSNPSDAESKPAAE